MAFLVHGERFSSEKNPGIFFPRSILVGLVSLLAAANVLFHCTEIRFIGRKQSKELKFYLFILAKNAVAISFICPGDPASDLEALYFVFLLNGYVSGEYDSLTALTRCLYLKIKGS